MINPDAPIDQMHPSSDQACALKAAGMKPEEARAQFARLYAEVMNDIPGKQ